MPSKPELVRFALDKADHSAFASSVYEGRFRENSKSSDPFRVNVLSSFEDLLGRNIHITWDHSQHDRPRVGHVLVDHVVDHRHVFFGGQTLGCSLEDSRYINDTEVLLVWTGDL